MAKRSTAPPNRRATTSRVLLDDLPRAEETARDCSPSSCALSAASRREKAAAFGRQVNDLAERTREADQLVAEATGSARRAARGDRDRWHPAAARVGEAQSVFLGIARRLARADVGTLDEIRAGIDMQSAAVAALVEQASAGIGKAGAEAAESLAANVDHASASLEGLVAARRRAGSRVAADDRRDRSRSGAHRRAIQPSSRRNGDERANRFLESLTRARAELDTLAAQAGSQDMAIGSIAERTAALRESIDRLTDEIRDGLGTAIGEAQGGADRLVEAAALGAAGNRLDSRCGGRGGRAAVGDRREHRRAAGPVGRASRHRRRRRRRCAVEADRARFHARAGRARGGRPQRRDRARARRLARPGQGSRRPRRGTCARSDRSESFRRAPASYRTKPATRSNA